MILLNYFIEAYYRTADEVVNIKKEPLAVDLEIHGMSGISGGCSMQTIS